MTQLERKVQKSFFYFPTFLINVDTIQHNSTLVPLSKYYYMALVARRTKIGAFYFSGNFFEQR